MPEGPWISRAVVRFIEPGNAASCAHCDVEVKFQARVRAKQVICNVYEDQRWIRVEHFHEQCYKKAGAPHGKADASQPLRQKRRTAVVTAA
jgi:hypothetical protein